MENLSIEELRRLCFDETIMFTQHLQMRMRERNIRYEDVLSTIMTGEIIEQYPTDYPHPSCLVLGTTVKKDNLHVVCGVGSGLLWIITAYFPNMDKWESDCKIRKE